jgi:hypothetical protein
MHEAEVPHSAQSGAGPAFTLTALSLACLVRSRALGASRTRLAVIRERLYRAEGQLGTSWIRRGGELALQQDAL